MAAAPAMAGKTALAAQAAAGAAREATAPMVGEGVGCVSKLGYSLRTVRVVLLRLLSSL